MEIHVYLEPQDQPSRPLILMQTERFRVIAKDDEIVFEYKVEDSLGHEGWHEFNNPEIAVSHFFTEVIRQVQKQPH